MFYVYVFGKGFFADIARNLGQEDFYNDMTSAKKFETQYEAQDAIKAYLIKERIEASAAILWHPATVNVKASFTVRC